MKKLLVTWTSVVLIGILLNLTVDRSISRHLARQDAAITSWAQSRHPHAPLFPQPVFPDMELLDVVSCSTILFPWGALRAVDGNRRAATVSAVACFLFVCLQGVLGRATSLTHIQVLSMSYTMIIAGLGGYALGYLSFRFLRIGRWREGIALSQ